MLKPKPAYPKADKPQKSGYSMGKGISLMPPFLVQLKLVYRDFLSIFTSNY